MTRNPRIISFEKRTIEGLMEIIRRGDVLNFGEDREPELVVEICWHKYMNYVSDLITIKKRRDSSKIINRHYKRKELFEPVYEVFSDKWLIDKPHRNYNRFMRRLKEVGLE